MKNKMTVITAILIATVITLLPWRLALADSTWTVYNQANSPLPTDYVASIDFDSEGNQYIGTSGGGVALIRDSIWTIWNQSNSGVPINAVRRSVRDGSGNLWLAAASGNLDSSPYGFGLARLDFTDSTWSQRNHGLEVNQIVTGIIIDGQTRYVSTYGGGITIFNDIGWTRYRFDSRTEFTYADSQQQVFDVPGGTYIPSDYVRAIDFDYTNGVLWMAMVNGGAVKYDGAVWQTFNSANSGLPSNQLLSIRINPDDDNIAFGTAGFGVAIYNNTDWLVYNSSNSPITNGFISTLEYRPIDGELWIGTGYGVWVLQTDDQWRGYIPPDNDFIWGQFYSDISFDSIGSVWVSAYGGGVASLFLDSLPQPPPTDSLSIEIERMYISFHHHRHSQKLYSKLRINNAPEISVEDSITFKLETDSIELYRFGVIFDDFSQRGHHHHHGRTRYRYWHDRLKIELQISDEDPSDIRMSVMDFDADIDRDNYDKHLILTMSIGDAVGITEIELRRGHHHDGPESDEDDEDNNDYDDDENDGDFVEVFGSFEETPTDIGDVEMLPSMTLEHSNYPNPFNGQTVVNFALPSGANVDLIVYDILGRQVDNVFSGYLPAGGHQLTWSPGRTNLNSGIYYYSLIISGEIPATGKMMYLK